MFDDAGRACVRTYFGWTPVECFFVYPRVEGVRARIKLLLGSLSSVSVSEFYTRVK